MVLQPLFSDEWDSLILDGGRFLSLAFSHCSSAQSVQSQNASQLKMSQSIHCPTPSSRLPPPLTYPPAPTHSRHGRFSLGSPGATSKWQKETEAESMPVHVCMTYCFLKSNLMTPVDGKALNPWNHASYCFKLGVTDFPISSTEESNWSTSREPCAHEISKPSNKLVDCLLKCGLTSVISVQWSQMQKVLPIARDSN